MINQIEQLLEDFEKNPEVDFKLGCIIAVEKRFNTSTDIVQKQEQRYESIRSGYESLGKVPFRSLVNKGGSYK